MDFGQHKICFSCHKQDAMKGQSQCYTCRLSFNRKNRRKNKLIEEEHKAKKKDREFLEEIKEVIERYLTSS